jgi:hypothetical protein
MKTIIRTSIFLVLFQLYSLSLFSQSPPQIWKLCIKGVVNDINDDQNILNGSVIVGDSIYGNITYDLSTPDTHPSPQAGDYRHNLSPAGFEVDINGHIFQTDQNNVDFLFEILNDWVSNPWDPPADAFVMNSYNNIVTPAIPGFMVSMISWQCDDPTGTALSNTDMFTSINLSAWQQWTGLDIDGELERDSVGITATITNVEVCNPLPPLTVVPVSNWALFIGIGLIIGFAVLRFRKVF